MRLWCRKHCRQPETPAVSDNDAVLLRRVIEEDDRWAFEVLVLRYQSSVRSLLRRLTRHDLARADDLAQETFLKVYRSLHQFKGDARFSTWLYRVTYNVFLSDQRRPRIPEEDIDAEEIPEAYEENTGDLTLDLAKALLQLTVRQQVVFELHYRKGCSHEEVADILDIPLGTVKTDILRGREALKLILNPNGGY